MEWIVEADSIKDVLKGHMVTFKRIIRCKDCKFRDDTQWCDQNFVYVEDNDFCSWAVRKENEDE